YGNPYYGYGNSYYGGYYGGYPGYYGGYYESPRVVNYGKRPSRHSAVVQPTQRTRTQAPGNIATVNSSNRTRQRQAQDEYYVRPVRRTSSSTFDNPAQRKSSRTRSGCSTPSSTPTRSRDAFRSP